MGVEEAGVKAYTTEAQPGPDILVTESAHHFNENEGKILNDTIIPPENNDLLVSTAETRPDLEEAALKKIQSDGGVEAHKNRYGSDYAKCPFIGSMGAAGVELAKKLESAEKDPNRGKTMAELLAEERAKQSQDESQKNPNPEKQNVARSVPADETVINVLGRQRNTPESELMLRAVIQTKEASEASVPPAAENLMVMLHNARLAEEHSLFINTDTQPGNFIGDPDKIKPVAESTNVNLIAESKSKSKFKAKATPPRLAVKPAIKDEIQIAETHPELRTPASGIKRSYIEAAIDPSDTTEVQPRDRKESLPQGSETKSQIKKSKAGSDINLRIDRISKNMEEEQTKDSVVFLGTESPDINQKNENEDVLLDEEFDTRFIALTESQVEQLAMLEAVIAEWLRPAPDEAPEPPPLTDEVPATAPGELIVDIFEGHVEGDEEDNDLLGLSAAEPRGLVELATKAKLVVTLDEIARVIEVVMLEEEGADNLEDATKQLEVLSTQLVEFLGFAPNDNSIHEIVRDILAAYQNNYLKEVESFMIGELNDPKINEFTVTLATTLQAHFIKAVRSRVERFQELSRYILTQMKASLATETLPVA